MKGKLWQIFGPVIIAAATLLFLLFAPFNYSHFSAKDEERAAVALNSVAFKNQQLKKTSLAGSENTIHSFLRLIGMG